MNSHFSYFSYEVGLINSPSFPHSNQTSHASEILSENIQVGSGGNYPHIYQLMTLCAMFEAHGKNSEKSKKFMTFLAIVPYKKYFILPLKEKPFFFLFYRSPKIRNFLFQKISFFLIRCDLFFTNTFFFYLSYLTNFVLKFKSF